MLGSRFLQYDHDAQARRRLQRARSGFDAMTQRLRRYACGCAMRFRFATLLVAVAMLVGTRYLFMTMPTGFIPSQDSGFMFGCHAWPARISRSSPWPKHSTLSRSRAARSEVDDVGVFRDGRQLRRFFFACSSRASERPLAVDQVIEDCGRSSLRFPGIMTFLQNPPPITISGQITTSAYQLTLQSSNLQEIYDWTPQLMEQDAHAARVSWT